MNYLSHFFIDESPGSHYYNTALILPDITKSWIKKFDPERLPQPPSKIQSDLINGSLKHYESDKRFHASAFFDTYQHLINARLKSASLSEDVNRKWFIAHILTELLIDRQIVKSDEGRVDRFYESLTEINDSELDVFLRYQGMTNTHDFFTFLGHFRNARYIYYYADNNKFLYSLGRIMMRVGIKELNGPDSEVLLQTILEIERDYMNDAGALLGELKAVFNQ